MGVYEDQWYGSEEDLGERRFEPFEYDDMSQALVSSQGEMDTRVADKVRQNISAKLVSASLSQVVASWTLIVLQANPLAGMSHEKLEEMGRAYAEKYQMGDEEDIRAFQKGACLAQDPRSFHRISDLSVQELAILEREYVNRWAQPRLMYVVIVLCSLCAAVQGMGIATCPVTIASGSSADTLADETVVNGAQLFYRYQFGIDGDDPRSTWLTGLLNSSPYLCCAFIGCWLTAPFNSLFGRRGTVFLTCCFSAIACFWQGFVNTWWHMFIARFFLGIGIGPKSATVPIYAAETTPPAIRGALVMQWQMWTAFGIMLGYMSDLAFYRVEDSGGIVGLNWRIMMASAMLPALIVVLFVFMCPESPRWYMSKNRHYKAYRAMTRLRYSKIQAARDVFYMHVLLEAEADAGTRHGNRLIEIVKVPRNRRAMVASEIVMFMQQVRSSHTSFFAACVQKGDASNVQGLQWAF